MHSNKNRSIDWVVQEGHNDGYSKAFVVKNWDLAGLDSLPAGVDYFVLDSIVVCGFRTVGQWVAVLTGGSFNGSRNSPGEPIRIGPQTLDPVTLIHALELARRRRHRTELDWDTNRTQKTNRVNRVVRRSVKLATGDKGNENSTSNRYRTHDHLARDYLELG